MERREFTPAEISGPKNAMGYPEAPIKSSVNDASTEPKARKINRKNPR